MSRGAWVLSAPFHLPSGILNRCTSLRQFGDVQGFHGVAGNQDHHPLFAAQEPGEHLLPQRHTAASDHPAVLRLLGHADLQLVPHGVHPFWKAAFLAPSAIRPREQADMRVSPEVFSVSSALSANGGIWRTASRPSGRHSR